MGWKLAGGGGGYRVYTPDTTPASSTLSSTNNSSIPERIFYVHRNQPRHLNLFHIRVPYLPQRMHRKTKTDRAHDVSSANDRHIVLLKVFRQSFLQNRSLPHRLFVVFGLFNSCIALALAKVLVIAYINYITATTSSILRIIPTHSVASLMALELTSTGWTTCSAYMSLIVPLRTLMPALACTT